MNYANNFCTFPKIIDVSFRNLRMFYSEDCGSFVPKSVGVGPSVATSASCRPYTSIMRDFRKGLRPTF